MDGRGLHRQGAHPMAVAWRRSVSAALGMRRATLVLGLVVIGLLTGCASTQDFTRDDGRKVNDALLQQIRAYGAGERALRPAIVRSAALKDPACDKQWELPFAVASSDGWDDDDRVAWVRGLGVDERLTVIASAESSPLKPGERIVGVHAQAGDGAAALRGQAGGPDAAFLLDRLAELRDAGRPIRLVTAAGRQVQVRPFEVCRGYTRLAPPNTPAVQDYHWLMSLHPLELVQHPLDEDEALWVVLWTQGLSEEGGARMKTFHYTVKVGGTLYNLATLASGLKGAAVAADAVVKTAQSVAAQLATEALKQQVIQRARDYAADMMLDAASDAAEKLLRVQMASSMQQSLVNRGRLNGVSRVAATVFDRADTWARLRMERLHANPLAGVRLHQRLAERGQASNAFVFDSERMEQVQKAFVAAGLDSAFLAVLKGVGPEQLDGMLGSMPLASAKDVFAYDPGHGASTGEGASLGVVASLLELPMASGAAR